ncbi:MAG TPA: hypothetical protein VH682_21415 [Gemmataceae bacterium]|jgi:transcription initiation factor IIE alpha subunit
MDTTILLVVVGVVIVLAFGVYLFLKVLPKKEEEYSHFRCPNCRRRLRYMKRQVGHKGKCSNCAKDLIFPPLSQSVD